MDYINALTISILLLIAFMHFYWTFGGKFLLDTALPTKDGVKLFNPSKTVTFAVGILILGFAFVVYELTQERVKGIYVYLGWAISAIFALRAIGDFNMVGFFKKIKETPFAIYDSRYFSPLCLYLSISIVCLL